MGKRYLRFTARVLGWVLLFFTLSVAAANLYVIGKSRGSIFSSAATIPNNTCGLLLGSDHPLAIHRRCAAAADLLTAGKIDWIVISGHPNNHGVCEPLAMKKVLEEMGVPEKALRVDLTGHRTLSSLGGVASDLHLTRFTIITDDYHMPRAIYLANRMGLQPVGFISTERHLSWTYLRTRLRECLARTEAVLEGAFLRPPAVEPTR